MSFNIMFEKQQDIGCTECIFSVFSVLNVRVSRTGICHNVKRPGDVENIHNIL